MFQKIVDNNEQVPQKLTIPDAESFLGMGDPQAIDHLINSIDLKRAKDSKQEQSTVETQGSFTQRMSLLERSH